jgi:hypothetical protein
MVGGEAPLPPQRLALVSEHYGLLGVLPAAFAVASVRGVMSYVLLLTATGMISLTSLLCLRP